MANPSLGVARLRTVLDRTGLTRGLKAARSETEQTLTGLDRRLDRTGKKLQRLGTGLTIGLTTPITALGVAVTRAASEAEETRSKFEVVFRDVGDAAERAAQRLDDSYGLSRRASQQLLADTGDLLTGFGFTGAAALDLSTQVNELAVDLASFTNYSGGAEGASSALTKALLGQTEAAKGLGIAIRADLVEAKIEEMRAAGELAGATDAQAKAYATLAIAQEQSKNAIGDFARTQDSFANQTRILNANLEDLRVALGEGILPIVTPLVGKLADAAGALSEMNEGTRNTIIAFGGLAAAAGPLAIALGSVAQGIVAIRTAALPLLGPAGILLGAAAGFIALNEAMNAGTRTRQQASTDYRDLIRSMGAYRDQLVITSEEERAQIQATLNRRREALQRVLEMQRAYVASLEADVIAFANKGFFGQLFGFGEANVNLDALENAQAELDVIEQQIAGIDTQLSEVREMEIRPNVEIPPPIPTLETYKRSVEDVFADLATAGTIAERRAEALGGTVEDRLASVETRAGLVSNAIDELFELGLTATDERVQYLVGRLETLQSEAERLQAILEPGGLSGRLARDGDGGLSDVVAARRSAAAADEERRVLAQGDPTRRLEAIREQLANGPVPISLADDESRRLLSQGDGARGRIDAATAARTDRLLAPALDEERRLLAQGGAEAARARIDAAVAQAGEVAEAQAQAAGSLTTFERETIAASTALVGLTRAQDAVLGVLGRAQAATIRGDRVAGGYGAAGDLAGRPVNFPTAVDRFEDPLAGPSSLDSRGKFVFSGLDENIGQAGEEFAQQQADSAKEFADTIIGAGQGFVGAISQFQAGNIGGGIASLAGAAGGIANFFAPGIGSLIGGAGGLLGGIINLFGGGGNDDLDAVRQQEAQRARSVPAITFEATVNQNNVYNGGPQQPEVEQAQRRHARIVVEEFMAATRLPQRVAALEGA